MLLMPFLDINSLRLVWLMYYTTLRELINAKLIIAELIFADEGSKIEK